MVDKETAEMPKTLKLDNLELNPYQYRDDSYGDNIRFSARIVLSKSQYAAIGKLPRNVKVVREGIDKEPRVMELLERAYSERDNEIKEEIQLNDSELDKKLPIVSLVNLRNAVIEQKLIIDELLGMLISNGIIKDEGIIQIKAKITEDRIREERRKLNRLTTDLDEFEL